MDKYPWIKFELDLTRLSWKSWMQLGECVSKCAHIKRVPLRKEVHDRLHKIYLSKGIQATTAIEGNTLTEEQVRNIIEDKSVIPPSQKYLEQEVKNIHGAYEQITHQVHNKKLQIIDFVKVCEWNKQVLKNVPLEENVVPGKIRSYSILVGNVYRPPEPQDVKKLLGDFCNWINGPYFRNDQIDPVAMSILRAITAHIYIAWIHPFGDGNGRTARLIEFAILLSSGIPQPTVHLLSNHYNATRTEYYRQLNIAGRTNGDIAGFLSYAIEGLRDGLDEQLKWIFQQVVSVSWQHYIYDNFRQMKNSPKNKRQRNLIIWLSKYGELVSKEQIYVAMVAEYKGKTEKTLSRDLNDLIKMGFVKKEANGYRAKREKILEYLPYSSKII